MRAAASSIASGRPSSRAQIARSARGRRRRASAAGRARARGARTARRRARARAAAIASSCSPARAQRGAARDHELRRAARRRAARPSSRRRVEHLLEVVEHEQQLALPASGPRAPRTGSAPRTRARRAPGPSRQTRSGPTSRGARRRSWREALSELEREPRLADAAGTGEREQAHPRLGEQRRGGREVLLAAEQRRRRNRKRGPSGRGARGGGAARARRGRARGPGRGSRPRGAGARPGSRPRSSTSDLAGAPEGLERVGLAPGAVEREHQLRVQALAVRMLGGEPSSSPRPPRGGRARGRGRAAPRARPAAAGEPVGLGRGRAQQRRVGERRPAEQRERLAQQLGRRRRLGARAARAPTSVSKRSRSSSPARAATRSPSARVTIGCSGPSARRSWEMWTWSAFGRWRVASPQSTSMSRSAETALVAVLEQSSPAARAASAPELDRPLRARRPATARGSRTPSAYRRLTGTSPVSRMMAACFRSTLLTVSPKRSRPCRAWRSDVHRRPDDLPP